MWCPTKNLGLIGSAVLTFIGYKHTDKQTNKQTDRQAKFINRYIFRTDISKVSSFLDNPVTSSSGSTRLSAERLTFVWWGKVGRPTPSWPIYPLTILPLLSNKLTLAHSTRFSTSRVLTFAPIFHHFVFFQCHLVFFLVMTYNKDD